MDDKEELEQRFEEQAATAGPGIPNLYNFDQHQDLHEENMIIFVYAIRVLCIDGHECQKLPATG